MLKLPSALPSPPLCFVHLANSPNLYRMGNSTRGNQADKLYHSLLTLIKQHRLEGNIIIQPEQSSQYPFYSTTISRDFLRLSHAQPTFRRQYPLQSFTNLPYQTVTTSYKSFTDSHLNRQSSHLQTVTSIIIRSYNSPTASHMSPLGRHSSLTDSQDGPTNCHNPHSHNSSSDSQESPTVAHHLQTVTVRPRDVTTHSQLRLIH